MDETPLYYYEEHSREYSFISKDGIFMYQLNLSAVEEYENPDINRPGPAKTCSLDPCNISTCEKKTYTYENL